MISPNIGIKSEVDGNDVTGCHTRPEMPRSTSRYPEITLKSRKLGVQLIFNENKDYVQVGTCGGPCNHPPLKIRGYCIGDQILGFFTSVLGHPEEGRNDRRPLHVLGKPKAWSVYSGRSWWFTTQTNKSRLSNRMRGVLGRSNHWKKLQ